jgi:IMP dehydrogenase
MEAELEDGLRVSELLTKGVSYTYDDCIFLPGHISFGVGDVRTFGRASRNVRLARPLLSSPMDTVTESAMASRLAALGGLGVLHTNVSASDQAGAVTSVKCSSVPDSAADVATRGACCAPELEQESNKLAFPLISPPFC